MKKCFVFVVCGAKEHIDTLHFSLDYLKRRTRNDIIILTDSSRNEIPVEHDKIVDVQCPAKYDHHQASIFLKTGIYRFLPKGNLYCYLDTDVVAIGDNTDDIFTKYIKPITFARDHCLIDQFSAYAVNCGCLDVLEIYNRLRQNDAIPSENIPLQKEISLLLYETNKSWIKWGFTFLRYILSMRYFRLNDAFFFDKKTRFWMHVHRGKILYEPKKSDVAKFAQLSYKRFSKKWIDFKIRSIRNPTCNHLVDNIAKKFDVRSIERKWNHWNGGVFLFDDSSHEFLTRWHQWTLACFDDVRFKTRDQGTLIATVWSMQLQHHPTLSKKWNLLADFHSDKFRFYPEKGSFHWRNGEEITKPEFVHVYHHWGDTTWDVWQWVLKNK